MEAELADLFVQYQNATGSKASRVSGSGEFGDSRELREASWPWPVGLCCWGKVSTVSQWWPAS